MLGINSNQAIDLFKKLIRPDLKTNKSSVLKFDLDDRIKSPEIFLEGTKIFIENFMNSDVSKLKEQSIVAVKLMNGIWCVGTVQTLILNEKSDHISISDNFLDKVYFIDDIDKVILLEQKHSENPIIV